jgi:hypothetical protein
MNTYLANIIPRIQNYSKGLNKKEQIVDRNWHLLQADGYPVEYTFTRNEEVFKTRHDGLTVKGKWQIIPATNQLYLDFPEMQTMLRTAFTDHDILVLADLKGLIYPFVNAALGITTEQQLVAHLEKKTEKPLSQQPKPAKTETDISEYHTMLLMVVAAIITLFLIIFGSR